MSSQKDFVSMEETLSLLRHISKNQPLKKKEEQIEPQKNQTPNSRKQWKTKLVKTPIRQMNLEQLRLVNKNRTIKSIIEASSDTLVKNYHPKNLKEQTGMGKSTETQLSIYMKQYNRLMGQMIEKQQQNNTKLVVNAESKQQVLQSIYQFGVVQDFREILNVAFCKDKIAKTNINMMIEAFQTCLVMLKVNQLRIYEKQSNQYRTIKMDQIQNVDYHTQPYIFIVLTVTKDKSKMSDYVYLKFDSIDNQEKWDHALYANYICRKMKKKQRMFQLEYPIEQEHKEMKEEIKGTSHSYVLQSSKLVDCLLGQDWQMESDKESSLQEITSPQKPNYFDFLRNHELIASKTIEVKRKQTEKQNSEGKNQGEEIHLDQINADSKYKSKQKRKQNDKEGQSPRLSPKPSPGSNRQMTFKQADSQARAFLGDSFNRQIIDSQKQKQLQPRKQIPQRQQESSVVVKGPSIKQKRIHELQKKHICGIIMTKQKFFFDKSKIVYFKQFAKNQINGEVADKIKSKNQTVKNLSINKQSLQQNKNQKLEKSLEYWDYELKEGQKSLRKVIAVSEINKIYRNDKGTLIIQYGKKDLALNGEEELIKDLQEWVKLCKQVNQVINQEQFIPKAQQNQPGQNQQVINLDNKEQMKQLPIKPVQQNLNNNQGQNKQKKMVNNQNQINKPQKNQANSNVNQSNIKSNIFESLLK